MWKLTTHISQFNYFLVQLNFIPHRTRKSFCLVHNCRFYHETVRDTKNLFHETAQTTRNNPYTRVVSCMVFASHESSIAGFSAIRYKIEAITAFFTCEWCTLGEIFTHLKTIMVIKFSVLVWKGTGLLNKINGSRSPMESVWAIQDWDIWVKFVRKLKKELCKSSSQDLLRIVLGTSSKFVRGLEYKRLCKMGAKNSDEHEKSTKKSDLWRMVDMLLDRRGIRAKHCNRWWDVVNYYNPHLKVTSKEYCQSASPRAKKICRERSIRKLMLTVFWHCHGVVQRKFMKPEVI